jgi:ankyrin repeat protein
VRNTVAILLLVLASSVLSAGEIHVAVRDGDKARVVALIDREPALLESSDNQYGSTPLHIAAHDGIAEIAEYLLSKGASVEAKDRDGATPLHLAALRGNADIAVKLLKAGANANAVADEGIRPLHLSAMNGHVAVVQVLLSAGADPNVRDIQGITPLVWAMDAKNAELERMLKARGAK